MKSASEFFGFDDIDKRMWINRTNQGNELAFCFCVDDRVDQSFLFFFITADALKQRGVVVGCFPYCFLDLFGVIRDDK